MVTGAFALPVPLACPSLELVAAVAGQMFALAVGPPVELLELLAVAQGFAVSGQACNFAPSLTYQQKSAFQQLF